VIRRARDLRYRKVLGEGLAIRQSTSEVLGVNEVGARVLDLIDGVSPISHQVSTLLQEFDVAEEILTRDLLAFLAKLIDIGAVELIEEDRS
jgi:hypothetical protein